MRYVLDEDVWPTIPVDDLWLFDKLIVSRKLGHVSGPACVPVPSPGQYVIRPCVNLYGMGLGAYVSYIESSTDHLPPGSFWQEKFEGTHYSVDYQDGVHVRTTVGTKKENTLNIFTSWKVDSHIPPIPQFIVDIIKRYPNVNVELIGDKVIEIHLRGNPDFDDQCIECIPIWKGMPVPDIEGYIYQSDRSGDREGFLKKY